MDNLQQGSGTISAFYAEVSKLISNLKWDDVAKRDTFRAKLSHKIKSALVTRKDDLSFEALVTELS